MYNRPSLWWPYTIFIHNRWTGTLHVCFSDEPVLWRFSRIYKPERFISNIYSGRVCMYGTNGNKWWHSSKRKIEAFWLSSFDYVKCRREKEQTLQITKRNNSFSLWRYLFSCWWWPTFKIRDGIYYSHAREW